MQVLMLKGLSLCPLTIRHFIAGLHLSPLPYLTLPILLGPVCQVLFAWLFNSRKETLLEGEFAIYFWRQKNEKGL